MKFSNTIGEIEIINEKCFSFGSADNVRSYHYAKNLDGSARPSSVHGILVDGVPKAVFGAGLGATGVHAHSAAIAEGALYVAVSNKIICLELDPFNFNWRLEVDSTTCFGIYFDKQHQALLSHVELQIARLSPDGRLIWTAGGADIFTGDFELGSEFVQVTDFNGKVYRFNYSTGEPI